jgi:hypothetical protein
MQCGACDDECSRARQSHAPDRRSKRRPDGQRSGTAKLALAIRQAEREHAWCGERCGWVYRVLDAWDGGPHDGHRETVAMWSPFSCLVARRLHFAQIRLLQRVLFLISGNTLQHCSPRDNPAHTCKAESMCWHCRLSLAVVFALWTKGHTPSARRLGDKQTFLGAWRYMPVTVAAMLVAMATYHGATMGNCARFSLRPCLGTYALRMVFGAHPLIQQECGLHLVSWCTWLQGRRASLSTAELRLVAPLRQLVLRFPLS